MSNLPKRSKRKTSELEKEIVMKRILLVICTILLALNFVSPAVADIKIKKKSRMNMPNMPAAMKNPMTGETMDPGKLPDTTVLIKGARMLTETRAETGGGKMILSQIRQCDLGREVSFNNKSKTYRVTSFNATGETPQTSLKNTSVPVENAGGVVTFSITYTDTGERAEMFGYTARHIKRVITSKPSANACETKEMKIETDGWYIDFPGFACPTFSPPEMPNQNAEVRCNDKIEFKINGKPDNGFAVKEIMTLAMSGMPALTMINEVTEITKTELDAALFDLPPGYVEDKESKKSSTKASNKPPPQNNLPPNANFPQMPAAPPAPVIAETPLQPKKTGVIRIGIARPNVKTPNSKDDVSAPLEISAAVRDSLVGELTADKVEAIRLSTDAPETEARQKECDYIFYANVTQKRGGGGFGKMFAMEALSIGLSMVPGVGMIAGTVGSVVLQQTMGKTAKAKDEFTFDYKITDLKSIVLSQAVTKAKTKKDGEDVLTPQVRQASKLVLAELAKKK